MTGATLRLLQRAAGTLEVARPVLRERFAAAPGETLESAAFPAVAATPRAPPAAAAADPTAPRAAASRATAPPPRAVPPHPEPPPDPAWPETALVGAFPFARTPPPEAPPRQAGRVENRLPHAEKPPLDITAPALPQDAAVRPEATPVATVRLEHMPAARSAPARRAAVAPAIVPPPKPDVRIEIGRIEVHLADPRPSTPSRPAPKPGVSLAEYLSQGRR